MHLIEIDLETLPTTGYDDGWFMNVVFSTEGSGSHTVYVYDVDLIESVPSYKGCLKDLRLYNRPLAAGEALSIAQFGEQLYEQPTLLRVGIMIEDMTCSITPTCSTSCTFNNIVTMTCSITPTCSVTINGGLSKTMTCSITPTASTSCNYIARRKMTCEIEPTASVTISPRYTTRMVSSINPTASVNINTEVLFETTCAITPSASVEITASNNAAKRMTCSINPTSSATINAGLLHETTCEITPTSSVTITQRKLVPMTCSINPTASVSISTQKLAETTCAITPTASVTITPEAVYETTCAINPTTSVEISASNKVAKRMTCSITPTTSVTINAGFLLETTCAITPTASVSIAAKRTRFTTTSITPTTSVSIDAIAEKQAQCRIEPTSSVSGSLNRIREMTCNIAPTSNVSVTAIIRPEVQMTCRITPTSSMSITPQKTARMVSTITPTASVTIRANADFFMTCTINPTASVTIKADYLPKTFVVDLADYLEEQTELDVYPVTLPQDAPLPAIVYNRSGTEFTYYLDGSIRNTRNTSIILGVFAWTHIEVDEIGQQLIDLLHGYHGYINTVNVKFCENSDTSDGEVEHQGRDCILRKLSFDIVHTHDTRLIGYDYEDEQQLLDAIVDIVGDMATFIPDIGDGRPLISVERIGPGEQQNLDDVERDPESDNFEIIVSGPQYLECLGIATQVRQGLGISVQDEYDDYDYDASNQTIYQVFLELEA